MVSCPQAMYCRHKRDDKPHEQSRNLLNACALFIPTRRSRPSSRGVANVAYFNGRQTNIFTPFGNTNHTLPQMIELHINFRFLFFSGTLQAWSQNKSWIRVKSDTVVIHENVVFWRQRFDPRLRQRVCRCVCEGEHKVSSVVMMWVCLCAGHKAKRHHAAH